MALTPNILMAVEGLLAETALAVAPAGTPTYTSQPIVNDYKKTIVAYETEAKDGSISADEIEAFIHALDDTAPYIANVPPLSSGITETHYTAFFDQMVTNLFPNNQQFVQYALIAIGHVSTANQYVNSAVSGQTLAAQTFTSSDALMSGNISSMSTSVQAWGWELISTGKLFDFDKLETLGTPQAIVDALIRTHMLSAIADELETQGLDAVILQRTIKDNGDIPLASLTQKKVYDALVLVVDDKLTDILEVMEFITPGIATLADLLDLRKVFPSTFSTLTTPNNGPLENIYNGNNISSFVNAFAPASTAVMPADQAKANYAFLISLEQIKGVRDSNPEKIGTAASDIESNSGLSATGALETALPDDTSNAVIESMGGGSGPDGTFYLTDLIGAPAGEPQSSSYARMDVLFTQVQQAGGFDDIAEVLLVTRDVLSGTYTDSESGEVDIPGPLPGNGTYSNKNSALAALRVELKLATDAYIVAYPSESTELFDLFDSSYTTFVEGVKQLWDADVRFNTTFVKGYETSDTTTEPGKSVDPAIDGLPANKKTTLAFAESLPQFGKKTNKGDIAVILEAMATDTLGGNAIVAAMREARNTDKLDEAGVTGDNQLSDQPSVVEPGNIS